MVDIREVLLRFTAPQLRRLAKARVVAETRQRIAEFVERLSVRLDGVKAQLGRLDARLDRLIGNGHARPARRKKAKKARSSKKAPLGPREGSLRTFVIEALRKAGAPVNATKLAEMVTKAGYKTTSKPGVFINALYVTLNKNPEFKRVKEGYALKA